MAIGKAGKYIASNRQCTVYCSFEIYIYVSVGSQFKVSVECCTSDFWICKYQVPRCGRVPSCVAPLSSTLCKHTVNMWTIVSTGLKKKKKHILNPCVAGGLFSKYDWNKMTCSKCSYLLYMDGICFSTDNKPDQGQNHIPTCTQRSEQKRYCLAPQVRSKVLGY